MHGRRSLNLELIPSNPKIDRTLRRTQRALVEIEIRGEMREERDNIPENVEQPRFENEDARAKNV
jgi:biotin carboxylase